MVTHHRVSYGNKNADQIPDVTLSERVITPAYPRLSEDGMIPLRRVFIPESLTEE
jgi:hypothetical protein